MGPQPCVIALSGRVSCGTWASRGKLTSGAAAWLESDGNGWASGNKMGPRTEGTPRSVGALMISGTSSCWSCLASARGPEQHSTHGPGISGFGTCANPVVNSTDERQKCMDPHTHAGKAARTLQRGFSDDFVDSRCERKSSSSFQCSANGCHSRTCGGADCLNYPMV